MCVTFKVLWRYEYVKAKYHYLPDAISAHANAVADSRAFAALRSSLEQLASGALRLERSVTLTPASTLVDEYAPSWFTRLSHRVVRAIETVWFHLNKEEALPLLSVFGTLAFILIVGYGLNYAIQDASYNAKLRQFQDHSGGGTRNWKGKAGGEATTGEPPLPQKEWHPEDPKVSGGGATKRSSTAAGMNRSASAIRRQK